MTVALTPALHTDLGQAIDHVAVSDAIGAELATGMKVSKVVYGADHVRFLTSLRITDKGAHVRFVIKLGFTGTYTVERGHLDRSTSEPVYRADQQLTGLAFDEIAPTIETMFVGAALTACGLATTTDA